MKKKKLIYLLTESVKNGVYTAEYKPYTEKQYKKMCKSESSKNNNIFKGKKKWFVSLLFFI